MFEFQGRCPHCSSDRGFFAFGVSVYTVGEYDYSKNSLQEKAILQERRKDNPLTEFSLAGTCIACKSPIVALCRASLTTRSEIENCIGHWEKGTNRSEFFRGEVNKYGWVDTGSSFLPSEIISAFLYAQLENLDMIQNRRKAIW